MTASLREILLGFVLGAVTIGCGGRADIGVDPDAGSRGDTGVIDIDAASHDAARDSGPSPSDAPATNDVGSPIDVGPPSDAGSEELDSDCLPPPCAFPPPGCEYVGATRCTCGELVCVSTDDCESEGSGPCEDGSFCDYPLGTCGGFGMCRMRTTICTRIYRPVCGCDGADYGNECMAAMVGVSVLREGECSSEPPDPPMDACESDADCEPGQTCMTCRTPGGGVNVCIPEGAVC